MLYLFTTFLVLFSRYPLPPPKKKTLTALWRLGWVLQPVSEKLPRSCLFQMLVLRINIYTHKIDKTWWNWVSILSLLACKSISNLPFLSLTVSKKVMHFSWVCNLIEIFLDGAHMYFYKTRRAERREFPKTAYKNMQTK